MNDTMYVLYVTLCEMVDYKLVLHRYGIFADIPIADMKEPITADTDSQSDISDDYYFIVES